MTYNFTKIDKEFGNYDYIRLAGIMLKVLKEVSKVMEAVLSYLGTVHNHGKFSTYHNVSLLKKVSITFNFDFTGFQNV